MEFKDYLKIMTLKNASDLYLTTGAPISAKIDGVMTPMDNHRVMPGDIKDIAYGIMDKDQIRDFEKRPEMNMALSETGVGRFRVNIFKQRNQLAMVIRHIKSEIPDWESLHLPTLLPKLIMKKRGLLLVVGATGSGKSTTLASLVDYRNKHHAGHIITIEDPVEFIHRHARSLVNQREVGIDTDSYEDALVNVLRQAPDLIMIGEVRDRYTMEQAITFAETGHLCVTTLHANNANQALDRIVNFFPEERHKQLLLDLSLNLRGILSQRLVPGKKGGRVPAFEVLLDSPIVKSLIAKGDIDGIKEMMEKSESVGMLTFDTALYRLYLEDKITEQEAMKNADSPNNLRLKIALESRAESKNSAAPSSLEIMDDEDDENAITPVGM